MQSSNHHFSSYGKTLLFILVFLGLIYIGGQLVSADNVQYVYDSLNRLIEVRFTDKVIRYTYDDAGNRTGLTVEILVAAPGITALSPRGALVGSSGFTLRISGSNFTNSSVVQWNGTNRATTFINSNGISIDLTAADIASVGTVSVVVVNSTPSLSVSNAQPFSVVQTAAFAGRVTSGGVGLANVTIDLTGTEASSVATDNNGNFNFAVLNNGNYTLTPTRTNYSFIPASRPVSYTGASQANLDFAASLVNYTISGRVARSNGVGVAGVTIALSGSQTGQTTTDGNGDYSINATAEGNYTITPSLANFTFSPINQTFNNLSSAQTADFTATPSILLLHTVFDFDGDGRTDVSVFRPSVGYWYLLQSTAGFLATPFGTNGDRLVPGDYDNDGKTDTAVWRPSNGYWYILTSSNGSFRAEPFGQAGDIPAAGDYDGDNKTDIAVWRPSNGYFYLLFSSDGSFQFKQWGQTGDLPVMGDYDGDGKTDFAVFRPSIGTFYVLRSSDGGVVGQQFGQSGDKPIAGDFDGDGKTDLAVFRPSNSSWYWLQSSDNGFRGVAWGTSGDIPSAGDYDGDGKWDVAVFRPSSGTFYILQSTTNALRAEQFGTNGDVPVPSAFVP